MRSPTYHKYHALGNDYWVAWGIDGGGIAKALCDRHYGLGADGLLVGQREGEGFRLTIWNADGSLAQSSGNGLRIFGAFLADQGFLSIGQTLAIHTASGLRVLTLLEAQFPRFSLEVNLGPASEVTSEVFLDPQGQSWKIYRVSIGNPHAVVFVDRPTAALACQLGPLIAAVYDANVHCVRVNTPDSLSLEIWERGSGYTLASGSSSAAAAAVAYSLGLCGSSVTAHMPGGELQLRRHEGGDWLLRGPVQAIGRAEVYFE